VVAKCLLYLLLLLFTLLFLRPFASNIRGRSPGPSARQAHAPEHTIAKCWRQPTMGTRREGGSLHAVNLRMAHTYLQTHRTLIECIKCKCDAHLATRVGCQATASFVAVCWGGLSRHLDLEAGLLWRTPAPFCALSELSVHVDWSPRGRGHSC